MSPERILEAGWDLHLNEGAGDRPRNCLLYLPARRLLRVRFDFQRRH